MRLGILRETRMPAVWCRLGPPAHVVEQAAAVTDALREAIITWCVDPSDDESPVATLIKVCPTSDLLLTNF